MSKKLIAITLVVLIAFIPLMGADVYGRNTIIDNSRLVVSGVIGNGQVNYVAEEIRGAKLDSLMSDITARPEISALINYSGRMGYIKQSASAYDITLTFNEQSSQTALNALSVDISYFMPGEWNVAHLKIYDFADKTIAGLVSYREKSNGFQIINVFQFTNGNVNLIQSIDTEKAPLQCTAANTTSSVSGGGNAPMSPVTCTACMFACGTFMALGCGLGLLTCVVAPWICLALFAFCGLLGYLDCATICGRGYVGACP